MGVARLRAEILKRRAGAGLSQRRAAKLWSVPVATIAAIEQGLDRRYQVTTISPFDEAFGWEQGTAWALLTSPDSTALDTSPTNGLDQHIREIVSAVLSDQSAPATPSSATPMGRLTNTAAQLPNEDVALLQGLANLLVAKNEAGAALVASLMANRGLSGSPATPD